MGDHEASLQSELARARAGLEDLEAEFTALADPEDVALDDEHDSEGSTIGFERARVGGLLDRSRRRVADLEAAAQRAKDGSYGFCASCGSEIGSERLAALPATQLCVACALNDRFTMGPQSLGAGGRPNDSPSPRRSAE